MTISAPIVIIGMINGMLGGVILVLPLLALDAGTFVTFFVILISGVFSYYSSQLCVKHLGKYSDLDQAILHHFDHSKLMKIFYDIIVFLNLSFLLILYFDLIVEQWQGMFQYSIANPLINCAVLFILVFVMKSFDFGASLLAYGIISIIGYIIFLTILIANAPQGDKKMQKFGDGAVSMAASMGQAFAIQTFFIPILRKNKNQQNYQLYTFIAYLIGIAAYMYMAYAGSYGILNIQPVRDNPQTIEEYFNRGYWQLYTLQILYLIHLYSVYPEFLLISKKRLFNAIGIESTKDGQIPYKQIIYSLILIGICLGISLSKVQIDDIIQLNGAVIGFFFIYFLPLLMHIKCLYFSGRKQNESLNIEIVPIQKSESTISSLDKQKQQPRQSLLTSKSSQGEIQSIKNNGLSQRQVCQQSKLVCYAVKPSLIYQILDMIMLGGMMIVGLFIMFDGVKSVFFDRQ